MNGLEIELYSSIGVHFSYHRVVDSLGYDSDMNLAVSRSKGDYVWPISDDDAISFEHLMRVIDELRLNLHESVFIFNAQIYDASLKNILIPRYFDFNKVALKKVPLEKLYNNFINEMSYTGVAIIKKSFWTSLDRSYLFNTLFITTGVIFTTKREIDVCCIDIPLVKMRFGNASWTSNYMKIWIDTWPRFLNLVNFTESDNSRIALRIWLKKCLIFKSLGVFRVNKVFELKSIPWSYKIMSLLILLVPKLFLVAFLQVILPRQSLIYLELTSKSV